MALECSECGLDLGTLERGGRFAGLLTAFVAVLLILIAYLIEQSLRPPLLLQAAFWAPATIAIVLFVLRFFKTTLLYATYERTKDQPK